MTLHQMVEDCYFRGMSVMNAHMKISAVHQVSFERVKEIYDELEDEQEDAYDCYRD